jgi:hypothetical protein
MKHQLYLEFPETNNTKILRIQDTSVYADALPIKCGTLSITSPGFAVPVQIEVDPQFDGIYNACQLAIINSDCSDSMPCLPDGLYVINYSVSPNDKVYVEYHHLRMSKTMNEYYQELCELEISGCEPSAEIKEKLKDLRLIKSLFDAAKAKVEYCDDSATGMDIFHYAQKLLNKYKSLGCCTCK